MVILNSKIGRFCGSKNEVNAFRLPNCTYCDKTYHTSVSLIHFISELKHYYNLEIMMNSSCQRVVGMLNNQSMELLREFTIRHSDKVNIAAAKVTELNEDISVDYIRNAFESANKDQVIALIEYGINVFSGFTNSSSGNENWVIDFYGMNNKTISRDTLQEHKDIILKQYKKNKWKISIVGGSISQFNHRRHFIAFLDRYVINDKNIELNDNIKKVLGIVLIHTNIASYM